MPLLLETALCRVLGRLVGGTSLCAHHENPWMLGMVVVRKRGPFFEIFAMTAVGARISATLDNRVPAFSKNFCHAATVPNAALI